MLQNLNKKGKKLDPLNLENKQRLKKVDVPEVPQRVHLRQHDKKEARPASAQFGFAFFASELPPGHD